MDDEKKAKSSKNPASPEDDEFANAPALVKRLIWLHHNRKRYWPVIAIAFLIAVVGWLAANTWVFSWLGIKGFVDRKLDTEIRQHVADLRVHFRQAADVLAKSGEADFSEAEADIANLKKLDSKNGSAWYYAGEIKRAKDARFDSERCPKMALPPDSSLNAFDKDFYRYLENIKDLSPNETGGGSGVEVCYNHTSGYCPQRTAWIHHLLANDLYAEGMVATEPTVRIGKLKSALGHAKDALRLYPQEGERRAGFVQCVPTESLVSKINAALESSR